MNAKTANGSTPLDTASLHGNDTLVCALLRAGEFQGVVLLK